MSSNTRCSGLSRQLGIQRLVWPARSPDLNPIENVWNALGRQVSGRNYPPTNKNTLIRALTEEWDKLPQQLLDNVVQSMVISATCTSPAGGIPAFCRHVFALLHAINDYITKKLYEAPTERIDSAPAENS
ncbi:hypothetical protein TNCV_1094851 [Trichonephila clavipes]|uniref:Tc1-like transposase DDE domain-containing protein n=1 Tax=Trichonephila clavipes TaxID=2585209 RepID=A0A8X6RF79_TRICX|nr:hypothetical protein TNCV_1094851 [Trichonephila clavipes]